MVFDRERNDAVRPSMRDAICWSAVLTMCVVGAARAQTDVPPGAQAPAATGVPAQPTTSSDAMAPATGSSRWTVESAETVGANNNVFAGAVGFPGLELQLIHGLDATTDVRAQMGLNYAVEGITQTTRFEFTAQVGIRKELLTLGHNTKLAGRFDPGILIGASPGQFGIKIPLGLELGIPLSRELIANASFDVPMFFTLGDFNAFYVPLLFGGGVEYLIKPNLAFTGEIKVGPTFITNSGGTQFTLYVLLGVAYKF